MADDYLQPVHNHFDFKNTSASAAADNIEDVDDDIFLNNSRNTNSSSNYGIGGTTSARSTNPFDDQQQLYAERRRQIEQRTLESTQKSLGLLYETEEVGKATALELAKQREQLEKTSRNLDEINSTLRFSQRHLNSLKSVFGGLKNYLSGNRDTQSPRLTSSPSLDSQVMLQNDAKATSASNTNINASMTAKPAMSPTERYDNHPISRIRDDSTAYREREQAQLQRRNNPFEAQLDANLEEMCGNLSRLKGLATDLGTEIETQNELLDSMNYKIEDVDINIVKQNKQIHKLLKK